MSRIAIESDGRPKYSKVKAIIGVALVVPWIIGDMVLRKTDASLGYSFGLFIGFVSGYLLSPQPPRLWVMLLIAVVLAVSHFVFVPHY
jgi:uncharacterized membrane protein YgaE (UPF0421/DUF939 family)